MVSMLERHLMTEPFYKLRFNTRGLLPLRQERRREYDELRRKEASLELKSLVSQTAPFYDSEQSVPSGLISLSLPM